MEEKQMLSCVYSAGLAGIDGYIVAVESDAKKRIPAFELVGLPDAAVKEAKERVRSACENSGFQFPVLELTVNLAPADKRKEGSAFDAAILCALISLSARTHTVKSQSASTPASRSRGASITHATAPIFSLWRNICLILAHTYL